MESFDPSREKREGFFVDSVGGLARARPDSPFQLRSAPESGQNISCLPFQAKGVLHRNGIHHPAIVGPTKAYRTERALFVPGIEDIGIAVGLEKPRPAGSLPLKEREGRGHRPFHFGFAPEFRNDGAVGREAQQLVFAVRCPRNRVFGLVEEPALEFAKIVANFTPVLFLKKSWMTSRVVVAETMAVSRG